LSYVIGVDTGGTFTDCVLLRSDGQLLWGKAPSTPKDFARGVIDAVKATAEPLKLPLQEILRDTSVFVHGTTVSTNAFLTRSGAKTGLLTTKGHEDAILIGRVHQKVAGLVEEELINVASLKKAVPIVPRPLIKGITERVDWEGDLVVPLDRKEVAEAVKDFHSKGVTSIAICFLWSFVNPGHERAAREVVKEAFPDMFVTISSDLAPVIKEYERVATTSLNAYLSPVTAGYISRLQERLGERGYRHRLHIMGCMGGIMTAEVASQKSALTLYSGPVGGAIGAAALGAKLGYPNIITSDVGGTSFDVGLIVNGEPQLAAAPMAGKYHILSPMVDIVSIGAGAGSIGWLEPKTGVLRVGPQSAGADPGPVCYGTGGEEPTVADADLVLGRLNPQYFLGGKMRLDRDRALSAIEDKIAHPLNMDVIEAARAVVDIVDAHMADLVRKVTIGRGYDPRNFHLLAFGGAGPTHVGAYARDVGVKSAIIPRTAGVFSAFGISGADMVHISEVSDPMIMPGNIKRMDKNFVDLEAELIERLEADGFSSKEIRLNRFLEMRYRRQVHGVFCPMPRKEFMASDIKSIIEIFDRMYEQKYGQGTAYREAGIEATTFRVVGIGPMTKPSMKEHPQGKADARSALKEKRAVYFGEFKEMRVCEIYEYDRLAPGNRIEGPAIIEGPHTTVVIHPKQWASVDNYLNLILHLGRR
jgi:N-methylhydantoinase A